MALAARLCAPLPGATSVRDRRPPALAAQRVVQQRGEVLCLAVLDAIDIEALARGVGAIETLDPLRRLLQVAGLARQDQHRIEPMDGLKPDHLGDEIALLGLHRLRQLGDELVRRGMGEREDARRLALEPVEKESQKLLRVEVPGAC